MLNQVNLMGNLVRDPDLRSTPAGVKCCDFTVAVNESWKDDKGEKREHVDFIDCTAWGRAAEVLCQYRGKGEQVFVTGKLQQDKWQDKETGQPRSKIKVTVRELKLVGGRKQLSEGDQREATRAKRDHKAEFSGQQPVAATATAPAGGDVEPEGFVGGEEQPPF